MNVRPHSPRDSGCKAKRPGGSRSVRQDERDDSTHVLCRICRRWYRAVTYTHLRYKHGIEDPRSYKKEFSLSTITAGQVRQKIAERKVAVDHFALDYIRKNWGKIPLSKITAYLGIAPTTIRSHARRLGLAPYVESWSRPKIIASLRRARRQGHALHSGSARHKLGPLYKAAVKYFGSWRKALEEAGIPYEKVARRASFEKWSPDRILQELRSLANAGKEKDYAYIELHHSKLYAAARNHFKNWREALRAAGFQP